MSHDLDSTVLHVSRLRLVTDYPGQIDACLNILTDDELWWRPNERSNAVANLVLHLSGSNRYYFENVIAGHDVPRDRAAEFGARRNYSRAAIVETWTEARRITEDVLNTIQPAQLMQTTDRSGKTSTYAQILLHVTHHNAAHMGQIVWMTKMMHPTDVDELWMKMQGRVLPPNKI
jgi:uncharacterized damage-inducible protein DinB